MLVGGVVVDDQMHCQVIGHFPVDGAQELQELLVAVLGQTLPDDLFGGGVEGANKLMVPCRL